MRCLYCGNELTDLANSEEQKCEWHSKCIRSFFGTNHMPEIDLSQKELEILVEKTVNRGFTIPGVQKKLSLHLTHEDKARLTIVDYPTGYILKPQTEDFTALPEAEDLCMRLAKMTGIKTVPHALIKLESQSGAYAYITKRIDRNIHYHKDNLQIVELFAMEDFCQLSYRLTQDKYRGSYEKCASVVQDYSDRAGLDMTELFLRIVFSFVTGNSDMHLKNFSLIETKPGSRQFVLSDAYDLVPVSVILPEDQEQLALTLNGKKRNIHRKDFLAFADNCSVSRKSAENMMNKIVSLESQFLTACEASKLPEEMKAAMKKLISERVAIIA